MITKIGFLIALLFAASNCAYSNTITCDFDFGLQSVSFGNVLEKKTLTKEMRVNGLKIKYHVNNTGKFNDADDYVVMENDKGHKMTYALKCY